MKERNSLLGILLPGIIGILFAGTVASITVYFDIDFSILLFFDSYLIGFLMIKYLNYYTTFHKVLAGVYAFIAFFTYHFVALLILYIMIGADFNNALQLTFNYHTIRLMIHSFGFFDWLILIVMPISAYAYLNYRNRLRGF